VSHCTWFKTNPLAPIIFCMILIHPEFAGNIITL
jgi:hypothetical protein